MHLLTLRIVLGLSLPSWDVIILACHVTKFGSDNSKLVPVVLLMIAKAILNPMSYKFNESVYWKGDLFEIWILGSNLLNTTLSLVTANARTKMQIKIDTVLPREVLIFFSPWKFICRGYPKMSSYKNFFCDWP